MIQSFEAQSTDPTAIRSFSCVGTLMDFQDVGPGKALSAQSALVWFLLCVNTLMQLEVPQSAEFVPTQRAGVGLVSSLTALVPSQVTEGRVPFPTVAAQVEPFPLVDTLVHFKVAGQSELLTALVTCVSST